MHCYLFVLYCLRRDHLRGSFHANFLDNGRNQRHRGVSFTDENRYRQVKRRYYILFSTSLLCLNHSMNHRLRQRLGTRRRCSLRLRQLVRRLACLAAHGHPITNASIRCKLFGKSYPPITLFHVHIYYVRDFYTSPPY